MDGIDYKVLTDYFDSRYVLKDSCSERHKRTEDEINEIKITQAKNTTQLNLVIKIGSAAAIAAVGSFATQLCSLIFK